MKIMDFDTFLKIALSVMTIVSYIGYQHARRNVYKRTKKYRIERYMK